MFKKLILIQLTFLFSFVCADCFQGSLDENKPQPVYSLNPQDSWNRIFHHLFTRSVRFRATKKFPETGPFIAKEVNSFFINLSGSVFTRIEKGDRAITPLYTKVFGQKKTLDILHSPRYTLFKEALEEALKEKEKRPPLACALMQHDLWAAYDEIYNHQPDDKKYKEKSQILLSLLSQLIHKIALTPTEIKNIPNNYNSTQKLPDLFVEKTKWMEIEWYHFRLHDEDFKYRQATRIFIKTRNPIDDKQSFLHKITQNRSDFSSIEAVALITQLLLIEKNEQLMPSPLFYQVQVREFIQDQKTTSINTKINVWELSRQSILKNPLENGLIPYQEEDPEYLTLSGNDYSFARPHFFNNNFQVAILGSLRQKCATCHGEDLATILTFNVHFGPENNVPPVRLLNSGLEERANYSKEEKKQCKDFQSLIEK